MFPVRTVLVSFRSPCLFSPPISILPQRVSSTVHGGRPHVQGQQTPSLLV